VVIYANGSYSWSVKSVMGLMGMLTGGFSGAIECKKERSANMVVILKAWSFVKDPKVVRNASRDSYSWLFESKSIISAFIDSLRDSSSLSSSL
jgi:hypothetical protein